MIDKLLISDLVFELKARAVKANPLSVKEILRRMDISNSKELVNHYGWKENVYDKFCNDFLKAS